MSTPEDEAFLARYTTEAELQMGYSSACAWVDSLDHRMDPEERRRGVLFWQRRIRLLKSKALLMGINLED